VNVKGLFSKKKKPHNAQGVRNQSHVEEVLCVEPVDLKGSVSKGFGGQAATRCRCSKKGGKAVRGKVVRGGYQGYRKNGLGPTQQNN